MLGTRRIAKMRVLKCRHARTNCSGARDIGDDTLSVTVNRLTLAEFEKVLQQHQLNRYRAIAGAAEWASEQAMSRKQSSTEATVRAG